MLWGAKVLLGGESSTAAATKILLRPKGPFGGGVIRRCRNKTSSARTAFLERGVLRYCYPKNFQKGCWLPGRIIYSFSRRKNALGSKGSCGGESSLYSLLRMTRKVLGEITAQSSFNVVLSSLKCVSGALAAQSDIDGYARETRRILGSLRPVSTFGGSSFVMKYLRGALLGRSRIISRVALLKRLHG